VFRDTLIEHTSRWQEEERSDVEPDVELVLVKVLHDSHLGSLLIGLEIQDPLAIRRDSQAAIFTRAATHANRSVETSDPPDSIRL